MISSFGRRREAAVMFCVEALRNACRVMVDKDQMEERVAVAKRTSQRAWLKESCLKRPAMVSLGQRSKRSKRELTSIIKRRWRLKLLIAGGTL